eukprot:COSAG01_NODE_30_length_36127_cov_41.433234_37_plen_1982_part_00
MGSEMSGGVRNITFEDSTSTGIAGIRISSQPGRGGFVKDVVFRRMHFEWKDKHYRADQQALPQQQPTLGHCNTAPHAPFLFHVNQAYRSDNKNTSVVSVFSNFLFEDITATGPSSIQVGDFTGGAVPISGLVIRNLTVSGLMASHSRSPMCCFNVSGVASGVEPESVLCKQLRRRLKSDETNMVTQPVVVRIRTLQTDAAHNPTQRSYWMLQPRPGEKLAADGRCSSPSTTCQGFTANQVLALIEKLKPTSLERFVSGQQDLWKQVPTDPGMPNMTVKQFLNAAQDRLAPGGDITVRASLNEWCCGKPICHAGPGGCPGAAGPVPNGGLEKFLNTTAQLYNVGKQLKVPFKTIGLDNWSGPWKSGVSPAAVKAMLQAVRAQGWKSIAVNEVGGFFRSFGLADTAEVGVVQDTKKSPAVVPNTAKLAQIKKAGIANAAVYVDFPAQYKQFDTLTVDQQADSLVALGRGQVKGGYTFVWAVLQGHCTPLGHYNGTHGSCTVLCDTTRTMTNKSGKYGGKSLFDVILAETQSSRSSMTLALPTRADVQAAGNLAFKAWAMERPTYNVGAKFNCTEGMECHWTGSTFLLGVMAWHRATGEPSALRYAQRWAEFYNYQMCGERAGETTSRTLHHNINHQLSGAIYVELFMLDGNRTHLQSTAKVLGEEIADPATVNFWSWVDAVHMAMNTYARMGVATGNATYFEKQFANFNASVLAPADGLNRTYGFWNASDKLCYRDDRFLGTQVYWSRGNGWAIAALVAALESGKHGADPHYAVYLGIFKKLAAKLLTLQSSDGAWRSSLLDPKAFPVPETTGTANFVFAFAWGINVGILPASVYKAAVSKGWQWLTSVALHADGTIGNCQPGGDQPENNFNRSTSTNFCVGQFLLAASEVWRLSSAPPKYWNMRSVKTDDDHVRTWNCSTQVYCSTHKVLADAGMNLSSCEASCASAATCFAIAFYPNLCGPTRPGSCFHCEAGYLASRSACPHAQLCLNPTAPPPPPLPPPPTPALPGWAKLEDANAMRYWAWPGDYSSIPGGTTADTGSVDGMLEYMNATSVDSCEAACAKHATCGVWTSKGSECYLKLDNIWWPTGASGSGITSGCVLAGNKPGVTVYNCGASPRPACCSGACSSDPRCDLTRAYAPPPKGGTCDVGSPSHGLPWCNRSMSFAARAAALTGALTVEEKLRLWTLHSVSYPIARLNIKSFARDTICQHGLSNNWNEGHWWLTNSTVFPHGINQGASFDLELVARIGNATAIESRATNNIRFKQSNGQAFAAILCDGGPLANTAVHVQWGRTAESFGECPFATGAIGQAAVNAMQQRTDGRDSLTTAVVTRHYMGAHQSNLLGRSPQMNISARELSDHYLVPYQAQLTGAAADGIMCSFSNFNGRPSCASAQLLQSQLRDKMKSSACVVSDCCDSITSIKSLHQMTKTYSESIALAVKAGAQLCFGCDPNSARGNPSNSKYYAKQALDRGQISMTDLDRMTQRNFLSRFKLGEFEGSAEFIDAWAWTVPKLDTFQKLAREAAAASCILLKNEQNLLPLSHTASLAVIGPFAHCVGQTFAEHPKNCYLANYNGNPSRIYTILDGIRELASGGKVAYASGCEHDEQLGAAPRVCSSKTIAAAASIAGDADVTIAIVGLGTSYESEGRDRETLGFPTDYNNLLAAVAKSAKKLVLVSVSAGGVSSSWTAASSPAQAIVFVGYPGQNADGVADVLFGAVSPSARLPLTVYGLDYLQKLGGPTQEINYHLAPPLSPVGKTYRYYRDEALWSFGYGLSYTTFEYQGLSVTKSLVVTAHVTNTGQVQGAEVSQLYIAPQCTPVLSFPTPLRSLRGFAKNLLAKGETAALRFELTTDDFAISFDDGSRHVPPQCSYTVSVGGSQPGDPHAPSTVLSQAGFRPSYKSDDTEDGATITIRLNNTDRPSFGIGGLSAGASSRLLVDYDNGPRNDILDALFLPKAGAAEQVLKVEIGKSKMVMLARKSARSLN